MLERNQREEVEQVQKTLTMFLFIHWLLNHVPSKIEERGWHALANVQHDDHGHCRNFARQNLIHIDLSLQHT